MNKPVIILCNSVVAEIAGITNKVNELLNQNIDPSKIAVVYETDEYRVSLEQHFTLGNMSFCSKRNIPFLKEPFINKIVQIMRYINAEYDRPFSGDHLIFEILHFDFYEVPPVEIAKLAVEVNKKKHGITQTAIRKLLRERANAPAKDLFDTGIDKNLKIVSAILEKLIADVANTTLYQLFENILRDGLVLDYVDKNEEAIWLKRLLNPIDEFIKTETTNNPLLKLSELLEVLTTENFPMQESRVTGNENQVQFVKDLKDTEKEFEYIFIAGANELTSEKKAVDELTDYGILNQNNLRPEIAHLDEAIIAPVVDKFVMNVSALNSYLNCPLGFYYKNLLRIPTAKNEAMEFGSAIHHALEKLFKKMSAGNGTANKDYLFPSAAEMIADFKQYMLDRRHQFTNEAFEKRMQYGEEVLYNYYKQYINSWKKVISVERNFSGITVYGVPLKGKLDKLEFDGKDVNIVDYKSGNVEKALQKMKPPDDEEPNGGDYWRQAVFYKILVDNYEQKDWRVIGVEFDFIEPDKEGQYRKERVNIHPADITTVVHQFTEVWHKIQARAFYTGCGKKHCHWCNFVKDNKLAIALHPKE